MRGTGWLEGYRLAGTSRSEEQNVPGVVHAMVTNRSSYASNRWGQVTKTDAIRRSWAPPGSATPPRQMLFWKRGEDGQLARLGTGHLLV